jgi:hypothetical protein
VYFLRSSCRHPIIVIAKVVVFIVVIVFPQFSFLILWNHSCTIEFGCGMVVNNITTPLLVQVQLLMRHGLIDVIVVVQEHVVQLNV